MVPEGETEPIRSVVLQLIGADGRLPTRDVDLLAHMVVAAVNEAALLIARARDSQDALARGEAAVDILLDRLVAGDPTTREF